MKSIFLLLGIFFFFLVPYVEADECLLHERLQIYPFQSYIPQLARYRCEMRVQDDGRAVYFSAAEKYNERTCSSALLYFNDRGNLFYAITQGSWLEYDERSKFGNAPSSCLLHLQDMPEVLGDTKVVRAIESVKRLLVKRK